ncbi:MAG TPA: AFG1/ZapE family ATPase, partial [Alphaproteobacteria bacterium]|nr:AFG1/ZapE family ATPase [Alphaproteobacteria bacterium]
AASDYLAFAARYHTFLLEDVPLLGDAERDASLRFIHLVDVLYEKHANIVLSAAAPLESLMDSKSSFGPRFARTQSRLFEMQSEDYINAPVRERN